MINACALSISLAAVIRGRAFDLEAKRVAFGAIECFNVHGQPIKYRRNVRAAKRAARLFTRLWRSHLLRSTRVGPLNVRPYIRGDFHVADIQRPSMNVDVKFYFTSATQRGRPGLAVIS